MAKSSKSSPPKGTGSALDAKVPMTFKETHPENINPFDQQFAPTDECPVRQNKRMDGVS